MLRVQQKIRQVEQREQEMAHSSASAHPDNYTFHVGGPNIGSPCTVESESSACSLLQQESVEKVESKTDATEANENENFEERPRHYNLLMDSERQDFCKMASTQDFSQTLNRLRARHSELLRDAIGANVACSISRPQDS